MNNQNVSYCCSLCEKTGVKLWVPYIRSVEKKLLCVICTCKEQMVNLNLVAEDGTFPLAFDDVNRSHQIGWRVPAVVNNDGGFYEYPECPEEELEKWKKMPNK